MQKRFIAVFAFISILLFVASSNAIQCPSGTHTFSGGTEASDASLCIPDVGAGSAVNTGAGAPAPTPKESSTQNDQPTIGNRLYGGYDSPEEEAAWNRLHAAFAELDGLLLDDIAKSNEISDEQFDFIDEAYNNDAAKIHNDKTTELLYDASDCGDACLKSYPCWQYNINPSKQAACDVELDACQVDCNSIYDEGVRKADQEWLNARIAFVNAKAAEYEQRIQELKASGKTGTGSGSAGFDTGYNRGRDEFERINPSIKGYLGNAYVVRADGTKVIPGKELYLSVGDSVISGKNSNINIIFSNAGKINLGHDTQLRVGTALLDQYYLAKGTLKTKLDWGILPPQKLEFHTPNAVVSVKGTEFVIDYNETANITTVYLNEGTLELNIRNRIINLTAGNYLVIHPDGAVWKYQLKPKNWDSLGNNFYEAPQTEKAGNAFHPLKAIIASVILVFLIILLLWAKHNKKFQTKNKSTKKRQS